MSFERWESMKKTDVSSTGMLWRESHAARPNDVEDVQWLWPGRIPVGKVTLIEGDEGVGKSFVALDLAARVSREMAWPDGAPYPDLFNPLPADHSRTTAGEIRPGRTPPVCRADDAPSPDSEPEPEILMLARPDEFESHRRRLAGLGADLSKFCWWRDFDMPGMEDDEHPDGVGRLEFPRDLAVVQQQLEANESISVVVIDSLADFCRRPQDVADTLRGLNQIAEAHLAAILVTLPVRTRFDGQGVLRVTSRWRNDGARNVWCVAADPDDPQRKLFIPRRVNFCEAAPGLEFRLEAGRVTWNSASRIDPLDPLDHWKSLEKCLNGILLEGCVPATDVLRQGSQCGFTAKQMRSGAHRLGIESHKSRGYGSDGCWVWYTAAQRQMLLEGTHDDEPATEARAALSAPAEGPVLRKTLDGDRDVGWALPTDAADSGGQSPPYGNVLPVEDPALANAKNAESLEDYREIMHQVWNDLARDKPIVVPTTADVLPPWKRPRKKELAAIAER
jgi:hypothetical protein